MTDVYSLILDEFKDSKICYVERFAPYYIISIGAHLFNLRNRRNQDKEPVFIEGAAVPDTRLHLMFVGPPGCGKTFWIKKFIHGHNAILAATGIDCGMKGPCTEAGFVGSFHQVKGEIKEKRGMCKVHIAGIVGIDEFGAITACMESEHSKMLDTQFLRALDDGCIQKDLGTGNLDYTTYMTLLSGTQSARIDLRTGMSRRFIFLTYIPTDVDREKMRMAYFDTICNQSYKPRYLDAIRKEIMIVKANLNNNLHRIEVDRSLIGWYNKLKLEQWEIKLFNNMIIGYQVMRGNFDNVLKIELDETIRYYILDEIKHRRNIQRGMEYSEVLQILRSHGGKMGEYEFKEEMLRFSRSWDQSTNLLSKMVTQRAIIRDRSTHEIRLSPHLLKESLD